VARRLARQAPAHDRLLVFILSNILWVVWGWHDHAHALIALQVALAALNIRGVLKNEPEDGRHAGAPR